MKEFDEHFEILELYPALDNAKINDITNGLSLSKYKILEQR